MRIIDFFYPSIVGGGAIWTLDVKTLGGANQLSYKIFNNKYWNIGRN